MDVNGTSGLNTVCYVGAAFDGRFMYLVPSNSPSGRHGRALRYDTADSTSVFQLQFDIAGSQGGLGATAAGPRFLVNTQRRAISASSSLGIDEGWHHLVGVFDGGSVALYVDGALASRRDVIDPLVVGDDSLTLGGEVNGRAGLEGALDEVLFYQRALSPDSVARLYADRATGVCR